MKALGLLNAWIKFCLLSSLSSYCVISLRMKFFVIPAKINSTYY